MPHAIDSPKARSKPRKPASPPEQDDLTPEKIAELRRGVLRRRREMGWVFDEEGEA